MNVSKFVPVASPFDAIHTLEIIPNLARGRARAHVADVPDTPARRAPVPAPAGIDCNLLPDVQCK